MDLELIFGPSSRGNTPAERAATSDRVYVRSQRLLAEDSPAATGLRYRAQQALAIFGLERLRAVATDGATPLIELAGEPAKTLREKRRQLGLSPKSLAARAGVAEDDVRRSEIDGEVLPYRMLERIAQDLALDERVLGFQPSARSDSALGTRLRDLRRTSKQNNDYFITALSDAAWTIRRQEELQELLFAAPRYRSLFGRFDAHYSFPAYERGYLLAAKTRELMDLAANEPIQGLHEVIAGLDIPLIYADLGNGISGATIANGAARGIAVSDAADQRPLGLRMTLAHELGHHLWDSSDKLEAVRVEPVERHTGDDDATDPVEIRASAFAVAFIAPPGMVAALYEKAGSLGEVVTRLVEDFGMSPQAAARHLSNICKIPFDTIHYSKTVARPIERKWREAECRNEFGGNAVRLSRTGRFAELVATAVRRGLISADSGASWLRIDQSEILTLADAVVDSR